MFADYHVHTRFSDDSVYPMEQVIKDAIAMQMNEICFTDHVDYGIKEDWDLNLSIVTIISYVYGKSHFTSLSFLFSCSNCI